MRETISLDLRQRILSAYDEGEGTREDIAKRFKVSLGMVKKLLQQRRRTGKIESRHKFSGRKAKILPLHRARLRGWLSKKPDLTLKELRHKLDLLCTLSAIHYVLVDMGLTYKKRRSAPASKIGRTSHGSAAGGAEPKPI
jgi:transposase